MKSRSAFAKEIAKLQLTHVERAVALLYYYSITQDFEERSAGELAADLAEEGFPKPPASRLREELKKNRFTIKGKRRDTFRIDVRRLMDLENKYASLFSRPPIPQSDTIIPMDMIAGTRMYVERIVNQINACYDSGYYDGCAVLCRRLMESLILETYISSNRQTDIQASGSFVGLEKLIGIICSDKSIPLNRNSYRTMTDVKIIGDTAAHDRVYITQQRDIDDIKIRYRRLIDELITLSGIRK